VRSSPSVKVPLAAVFNVVIASLMRGFPFDDT
jgi:hypothetical protein